ncbi:MAG TPA: HAD-IIIA family hydrolase [Steroidobacteraceae bacterium]|jgi:3-deoxy-D-manno-octulosonate 8-phosphate phosphatase (KDO 8-P phosphatase)|nr:HAD-IIIA family hydrolase [Steroidobacteraceae bacterium]
MAHRSTPLAAIRLLVLDVDGVLTDGRLRYGPDGEREKLFHVRDGYGIRTLAASGVTIALISGRSSEAVARRCADLGIREVQQGKADKGAAFAALIARLGIPARECACIGDDTLDVPMMRQVGLAVAVADAHADARRAAHRRTRLVGGAGAVREVCDWLVAARVRARR